MVVRGTGSNFVVKVAVNLRSVRTEERHQPIPFLARNGKVGRFLQVSAKTLVTRHMTVGN